MAGASTTDPTTSSTTRLVATRPENPEASPAAKMTREAANAR